MTTAEELYQITCVSCGKKWREEDSSTNCPECGGALDVQMDLAHIAHSLNRFLLEHAPLSSAKYLDFYPIIDRSKAVSFGEGNTPLYFVKKIGDKLGMPRLYIKNEGANPTGVFKDRGSLVEITKALEMGAKGITVASTGNMAASVAAYASRAGLPCYILVPEGTPIGKLSQTLSYGGKLIQIRGTYADCVVLAEALAKRNGYYLAGDYAFRAEGAKSTAFEIIEQLHWQAPDAVIVPMGCGTNLAGIFKGFREFFELGLIDRLPKMIGVQPEGCDTLCTAFAQGEERFRKVEKPQTVASAVGIGVPQDDIKCLRALRDSQGATALASDARILAAQKEMAGSESIFTEPSGAIPVAVLPDLIARGVIGKGDLVVCVATGTGLKDPKAALGSFSEPPSLDPEIDKIEAFLTSGTLEIRTDTSEKEVMIFQSLPSKAELAKTLSTQFNYQASDLILRNILEDIAAFSRRGKEIRKADLLRLLQEAIENTTIPTKPLKIVDFESKSGLLKSPIGYIRIDFDGRRGEADAEGVGPVDALIKALKKAIDGMSDFWPVLLDFQVEVASSSESALVKVTMEMGDRQGNKVAAKASNPDIIVAALSAFVKGYNLLYKA